MSETTASQIQEDPPSEFEMLGHAIIERYTRTEMQTVVELQEHGNEQLLRMRQAALDCWQSKVTGDSSQSFNPILIAAAHVIDNVDRIVAFRTQNAEDMAKEGYHRAWYDAGIVETIPLGMMEPEEQAPTNGATPPHPGGVQPEQPPPGPLIDMDALRSRMGLNDDEPIPCGTDECKNLATCIGQYEEMPHEDPACDECCGHSQEEGWCIPAHSVS